jgi:hypothetical protein
MTTSESRHPVRVLASALEKLAALLDNAPDRGPFLPSWVGTDVSPDTRDAWVAHLAHLAHERAAWELCLRETAHQCLQMTYGIGVHLAWGMDNAGKYETELRTALIALNKTIDESKSSRKRVTANYVYGIAAKELRTVAIRPLDSTAPAQALPPAQPSSPTNDTEAAVIEALRELGKRTTGPKLLKKALGNANSHGKAVLSSMSKRGLIDHSADARPRGYGLPEWSK